MFYELQICWEKGWKYEEDWLAMSTEERARWLAFVSIESWRQEKDREQRERDGKLKMAGAL